MDFTQKNVNTVRKNCRKYNGFYPNFNPVITSLSVMTSEAGVYSLVYIYGTNFLPNGNTYVNFGSVQNIPVSYYSSTNISFTVPTTQIQKAGSYSVIVVNIYNGSYGFSMKHPGVGSLSYSNSINYTITNTSNTNPVPMPDSFIYPGSSSLDISAAIFESYTYTNALTANYYLNLTITYLNVELEVLLRILTQANNLQSDLLAIQNAQSLLTQATNQNLDVSLYQSNLTSAIRIYQTDVNTTNQYILNAETLNLDASSSYFTGQTNTQLAHTNAQLAYSYAIQSTPQNPSYCLALNTFNSTTTADNLFLNNLISEIYYLINQNNLASVKQSIFVINTYVEIINIFILQIKQLITQNIVTVNDASFAILPLETNAGGYCPP